VFTSVVIATDIDAGSDRAIVVGTALAGRGRLPVEVLTVVSEPSAPVDDAWRHHVRALGVGDALRVVHGDDVGAAIAEEVRDRDGVLLVMSTSATGLVSQRRGSVSARVLSDTRQPVLLIGPAVPDAVPMSSTTLVACTDRAQDSRAALPVVDSWQRAFGGGRPWVVEVIATSAWPAGTIDDDVETEQVDAVAAVLSDHGIDAATRVLHGGEPVQSLLEFAEELDGAIFVTTSARWAGGRTHWYSTTRQLVQRSLRPVLVVPADLPGY
jgi:nucleotide-binding universal stress UspA family protein